MLCPLCRKPVQKEPEPVKKDKKAIGGIRVMPAELAAAAAAKPKKADYTPSNSSRSSSQPSATPEPAPRSNKSSQPLYDSPPEDEAGDEEQVLP